MCEVCRDRTKLMKLIEGAINSESMENIANIPDFILAEFLICCFNIFNDAVKKRDKWYSVHLEPANSHFLDNPPKSEGGDSQNVNQHTQPAIPVEAIWQVLANELSGKDANELIEKMERQAGA